MCWVVYFIGIDVNKVGFYLLISGDKIVLVKGWLIVKLFVYCW